MHMSNMFTVCRSGALEDMQQHGVECIDCFAVDNALMKPASPLFIGYCHSQNSNCGKPTDLLCSLPVGLVSYLHQTISDLSINSG